MKKAIPLFLLLAGVAEAVTILRPTEGVSEWIDNALTRGGTRLQFESSGTTLSRVGLAWRVSNLFISIRSENIRAGSVELSAISDISSMILLSLDSTNESIIPGDESTIYEYSGRVFFDETQLASLRDSNLQIAASPAVAGETFRVVPEPTIGFLALISLGLLLIRRGRLTG